MSDLSLDPSRGLVVMAPTGALTLAAVQDLIQRMLEHPHFTPNMACIWDLRGCDVSGMDEEDVRKIATFNASQQGRRGQGRVALVSTSDLSFGLTRVYGVLGDVPHLEFRSFRELEAAEAWALES